MTKKRRVKTKDLVRDYVYAQDSAFTVRQAAEKLGVSASGVGVQLRYMISRGVLRRIEGANDVGVPCYYYMPLGDLEPPRTDKINRCEIEQKMRDRILQYGGGPFAVMAAQLL